ncbi:MAG: redox-disulfide-like protein [Firmicutes bacterium]|nr:redox-disulfide-like protein [Bacillota bacterium]
MLPKGANLQKIRDENRTYAITPHLPGGFIKPDLMRKYADVAEKYHGVMKLTSAQRVMITGLKAEDIENIWQELDMKPAMGFANCVRSVKICPGNVFCKRGKQDSIKLGMELDKLYHKKEMPSRMKLGVAGCQNSCAEVYIKDIGVMGTDLGWDVYVGGSAGSHPRLADLLIEGLDYDEALHIVDVIVRYYQKNADIERVGQFIDRIGLKKFKADVLAEFYKGVSNTTQPLVPSSEEGREIVPVAGGLTEGTLVLGDKITADSVISDIIRVYPQTIPVFRSFGMGCLGCPSATGEAVSKAAGIHGLDVDEILAGLNKVI